MRTRHLGKVVGISLATLIVVAASLAGCGGRAGGAKQSTPGLQVFTYACHLDPMVFWDPSDSYSEEIQVMHVTYETLLRYDPKTDKVEPLLAESYQMSPDGLQWTFKLRQGVKFHCGHTLTSRHVKESVERTHSRQKGAYWIWDAVASIDTPDETTVVFNLKYPAPMEVITASAYGAAIMCTDCIKQNGDEWLTQGHEVGTGPYMLESWKRGEQLVLTKFPDYWRGWEGKHFDKYVIQVVPETGTARQMLEGGQVDMARMLTLEDIEALKSNPKIQISRTGSFQNLYALFNTRKGVLKNKLVRQALSCAVPYDEIVNQVMLGYASQSRGPVPKGLWGHSDEVPQYTHDLDKARELLKKAGYPDGGFKLLCVLSSGDENQRKTCELIKSEWQKIGVDLELRIMPWEAQWDLARSQNLEERQDIFVFYWWPDVPSPDTYLRGVFHTEDPPIYNLAYYSNPEVDKLMDEARALSGKSREEATPLYVQAQQKIVDDAVGLFLYDQEYVRALGADIAGYVDNPAYPHVVFLYDMYRK